ncbi:MAG TPA: pantoate--beta-alanine ligase [Fimbriimonadaceae bacterium]|nr:pantoate--beta-alanine ligase [Fimbriimonadaceae bacterium]
MIVCKTIAELRTHRIADSGFVPTMGALHEGHLTLMDKAKEECAQSIVSIFVNPLQFGQGEDFTRYPRPIESDLEAAERREVDLVFLPGEKEMYPNVPSTIVQVPGITELWEGASRPGHFVGVATVVAKLFEIVQPKIAYFGRKDFQQCAVVSRMIHDLNMPISISIQPTVREADGLALSSRNRYLSPEERQIVPVIYEVLSKSKEGLLLGIELESVLGDARRKLISAGFELDYFELVDEKSLLPVRELQNQCTLIFAGKIGRTRLIDNLQVRS